jgi:hypothetical protein
MSYLNICDRIPSGTARERVARCSMCCGMLFRTLMKWQYAASHDHFGPPSVVLSLNGRQGASRVTRAVELARDVASLSQQGRLRRRADKRERQAIGCVNFAPVRPGIGCARQKSKRDDHIESDRWCEINHADGNERPQGCRPVFAINGSNQHGPTSTYPAYT